MVVIFLLAASHGMQSQRIIVNANGDKVVMYPDGSWRFMEPRDSVLVQHKLQKSSSERSESGNNPENKGKFRDQDDILRELNELYFNIKGQEKKVQNEFRAATNAKFKAGELFEHALVNKDQVQPDRLSSLENDLELSIRNLKNAKLNQKAIRKIVDQAKMLIGLQTSSLGQKVNQLRSKYNAYLTKYDSGRTVPKPEKIKPEKQTIVERPTIQTNTKTEKNKSSDQTSYTALPTKSSLADYRSEPFKCVVQSDSIDEASGRRRIVLAPALIFTHTDPDLRPYFKNKELITCYGILSKIDAYVYLTIEFQIASSHSQSNFGVLQSGSLFRLKLLNGEYVSLYNIKSDKGRIDAYSGNTIFTGQYALGKDEIKMLQSSELDKVRILWSTGYEDYDVYKIDFFKDHLDCLMSR